MLHAARRRLALVRDQRGFTVLELIIVLVIIAILLTIAITTNIAMRQRASDAVAQSLVYGIVPSIEAYHADHGSYAGVTVAALQATYDHALDPTKLRFGPVTDLTYCVQATHLNETWRKNGPGQAPEKLPCP